MGLNYPDSVTEEYTTALEGVNSLSLIPRYTAPSAWWEHVPVAHWLIDRLKPKTVVELGTHYGVSFFAFCEAAEQYSRDTFIYAIDGWEGDEHAGVYDDSVFQAVQAEQQRHHRQRSRLIRSDFNEAVKYFSDESVDLLHIDGLHTEEAVAHDLATWKRTLRSGGSLLFHDINVRERDFGVWKVWEELSSNGEFCCLEVLNGHGLGIATLSPTKPEWHEEFLGIVDALTSKGALLDQIALLTPAGTWGEKDQRPYRERAMAAEQLIREKEEELVQAHRVAEQLIRKKDEELIQAHRVIEQLSSADTRKPIHIRALKKLKALCTQSPARG